jgi:simple sugar transport system ATP-binding protein
LSVHAGQVVGIAGIAGNGQSEFFAALSGERLAPDANAIRIAGKACGGSGVDSRRRLGAGFVPEERLGHAAAPTHRLSENALLSHHATSPVTRHGLVLAEATRRLARDIVKAFDVRAPSGDPEARTLSGGNLQKYVIGREIIRRPGLLVVDQPTWGVDAGAARLIRQALVDLARQGSAVLVISQDLDELFEIADLLAVIQDGHLTEARPRSSWTRDAIGLAMLGMAGRGDGAHAA